MFVKRSLLFDALRPRSSILIHRESFGARTPTLPRLPHAAPPRFPAPAPPPPAWRPRSRRLPAHRRRRPRGQAQTGANAPPAACPRPPPPSRASGAPRAPALQPRPARGRPPGPLQEARELSDLAPILWHSVGTTAALLQEIVSIYPLLSPPGLNAHASNRVCNALALLQCVASHPETRTLFLNAHIPLYLYPFLNTVSKSRPFEYLRLTSLGVIGALVKVDDPEVVSFLLQTEIIPLCLRIMETGSELSKTVATFIVQKILLDDTGLSYICATAERFYAVSTVLSNMVAAEARQEKGPSARLVKHIVRCYLRISENPRAREALRSCLPEELRNETFKAALAADSSTVRWLQQLRANIAAGAAGSGAAPAALRRARAGRRHWPRVRRRGSGGAKGAQRAPEPRARREAREGLSMGLKARCRECGGSAFCKHGKLKVECRICGGSAFQQKK